MSKSAQVFYYSRRKMGFYLLFNLGLLALAILFTWAIFPYYQPIYYFALITCTLSILGSLFVFLVRLPLAVIDDEGIKIDHDQPLKWSQVKEVEHVEIHYFGAHRAILKITPKRLSNYRRNLMQVITMHSEFGAFSIPLYAMSDKKAKQIEKLIFSYTKPEKKEAAKPTPIIKKKPQVKKKAPVKKAVSTAKKATVVAAKTVKTDTKKPAAKKAKTVAKKKSV